MNRSPGEALAAALLAGPPGRPWPSAAAGLLLPRAPAGKAVRLLWPGTRAPAGLRASADALAAAQPAWLRAREACRWHGPAALRGSDILLLLSGVSLAERLAARCFAGARRQALEGFFAEAGADLSASLRHHGGGRAGSPEVWALRAAFFFRALELGLGAAGALAAGKAALVLAAGSPESGAGAEAALRLPPGGLGTVLKEVYADRP